jgi:hypothetical protein
MLSFYNCKLFSNILEIISFGGKWNVGNGMGDRGLKVSEKQVSVINRLGSGPSSIPNPHFP